MTSAIMAAIFVASQTFNVDPYIIAGIIKTESSFNPEAIGSIGEIGLMQLRPELFSIDQSNLGPIYKAEETIHLFSFNDISEKVSVPSKKMERLAHAKEAHPELFDIETNIMIGTKYLADLSKKCHVETKDAYVVCFNRGLTKGRKVSSPTTNEYYAKVTNAAAQFKAQGLFDAKVSLASN